MGAGENHQITILKFDDLKSLLNAEKKGAMMVPFLFFSAMAIRHVIVHHSGSLHVCIHHR